MHGLLTGQESRQQLYTMLSRGRAANHVYLQVVGDGDPHTVLPPDTIAPRTPTEMLQQILVRDEAPVSASTLLRELSDPAARLLQAVQRYTDGLHVAAEQLVGPQTVAELDQVDQYIPGLTSEPAWRRCEPTCSPSRPKPSSTPTCTCKQPPADETSAPQATWPPSSTGASQHSRPPTQVRCPGYQAFHQRCMPILSGAATWSSDASWSPTSPTRSATTHANMAPSQPGRHRDVTQAPPSSVKSPCGGPPTASIPTTHDQPEEPNSKRSRPSGNNASTCKSHMPPNNQQMRRPTNDRRNAPPSAGSARTTDPNGDRAGRPRRPYSTPQSSDRGARDMGLRCTWRRQDRQDRTGQAAHCRIWLLLRSSGLAALGLRRCPRCAAGRAATAPTTRRSVWASVATSWTRPSAMRIASGWHPWPGG
jgi:hypothetical protein